MKALIIFLLISVTSFAQEYLVPQAGGEYKFNEVKLNCLTETQRAEIHTKNFDSIQKLIRNGIINISNKTSLGNFIWPVKAKDGLSDFYAYAISGFLDHDPAFPDQLLDYNGGDRTYDTQAGYNHKGTDIFTWPFAWYKMDFDEVEVIAAADGVIIGKDDGNSDRSCEFNTGNWNAVYVRNHNGSRVWYGHMKKNSLTTKQVGDSVFTGDYLGIVGSSGNSTGPHLHFEVYDSSNNLIDPWEGTANPTITSSWWIDQKDYYDSKINKIATHSAWPEFPDCPNQEIPHLKDIFQPGDMIYFITYYSDQLRNQESLYQIYTPENIVFNQWTHSLTQADHYAASWWGWSSQLPSNAALGDWRFVVSYNGLFYTHNFTVSNTTDIKDSEYSPDEFELAQNFPNPFNPVTRISFVIPSGVEGWTTLKVFNLLGSEVEVLVNEKLGVGSFEVEFNASNLPSGIYFYKLTSGNITETKKCILLK